MRKKTFVVAISVLAILMLAIIPVGAVSDGELDSDGHPYVGLMVAQDADGDPLWRCSGTLISPTLFLTAGHCTEAPAMHAEIWFDADIESGIPANGYPNTGDVGGTTHTHPQYNPNAFYRYDLGVVVLDEPMVMATYGKLPALNQLDPLAKRRGKQDVTFTAVGYGLQESFPDAAPWKEHNVRVRMVAHPKLNQINGGIVGDCSLLLSNNHHTRGTCFGDSGGPDLLGGTNTVLAVNSYVTNINCSGVGYSARVDVPDTLEWIQGFLP